MEFLGALEGNLHDPSSKTYTWREKEMHDIYIYTHIIIRTVEILFAPGKERIVYQSVHL